MEVNESVMTYVSLFSGIGGFELGIHRTFPNAKCLGYSEVDPNALKVYRSHFPEHPNLGDVKTVNGTVLRGKVDLLVGGSPCQDFSRVSKGENGSKGLSGAKSSLFYEYLRLLREIQPNYFILENVIMKKEHRDEISSLLGFEPVVLNSNIVSKQRRKRQYWCNFDISRLQNLPPKEGTISSILLDNPSVRMKDVSIPKNITETRLKLILDGGEWNRERFINIINPEDSFSPTLLATGYHLNYLRPATQLRLGGDTKYKLRFFHPIEYERLQTFPDDWTRECSSSKRYSMLGNAVTCDVIKLICECI